MILLKWILSDDLLKSDMGHRRVMYCVTFFGVTSFNMPTAQASFCTVFRLVDGLIADSCYIVFCNLFLYYILYYRETAWR